MLILITIFSSQIFHIAYYINVTTLNPVYPSFLTVVCVAFDRDGVQNGWGRVSAEYIHSQWHCIQLLLAMVTIDNLQLSSEAYVEWCMDALDLVSGETVFTAMRHLVSKVSRF